MSGQLRDGVREVEGMLPSPGLDQAGERTDGATEAQAHLDGSRWWQGAWQTVVGLQGVGGRVPGARAGLSVGRDGQGFPDSGVGSGPKSPLASSLLVCCPQGVRRAGVGPLSYPESRQSPAAA